MIFGLKLCANSEAEFSTLAKLILQFIVEHFYFYQIKYNCFIVVNFNTSSNVQGKN